jgi:hypothetical protein
VIGEAIHDYDRSSFHPPDQDNAVLLTVISARSSPQTLQLVD